MTYRRPAPVSSSARPMGCSSLPPAGCTGTGLLSGAGRGVLGEGCVQAQLVARQLTTPKARRKAAASTAQGAGAAPLRAPASRRAPGSAVVNRYCSAPLALKHRMREALVSATMKPPSGIAVMPLGDTSCSPGCEPPRTASCGGIERMACMRDRQGRKLAGRFSTSRLDPKAAPRCVCRQAPVRCRHGLPAVARTHHEGIRVPRCRRARRKASRIQTHGATPAIDCAACPGTRGCEHACRWSRG